MLPAASRPLPAPLASTLHAVIAGPSEVRLIHITDPHLTTLDHWRPGLRSGKRWLSWLSWQKGRRRRHLRSRLDALTDALQLKEPEVWAITGDLCQIGLDAEAAEAREWLDRLARPNQVLLVPGNHDIFANDSSGPIHRRWADYLHVSPDAAAWPVVRQFEDVALIGLNSAVVTPPLRAGGRLGEPMRERLEQVLAELKDSCRVVLIHHPPLPGTCKPRKALSDNSQLTEILRGHAPAMVLHGHLHHNREWSLEGRDSAVTRVMCTASASAADERDPASARLFDIRKTDSGFAIEMETVGLDTKNRLRTLERKRWNTPG